MNRYLGWAWVGVGLVCGGHAGAEPTVDARVASTAETAPRVAWAELLTSGRPEDLAPFYGRVLGWTAEVRGEGRLASVCLSNRGRPVAGIAYRPDVSVGLPKARWLGFLAVPEVASATAAATAAGARLHIPPRAWPGHGRQAVFADVDGALVGLLEPAAEAKVGGQSQGLDGAAGLEWASEPAGDWLWPVLLTKEPKTAAAFFGALVGGTMSEDGRTPMFAGDFLISRGKGPRAARAGVVALPKRAGGLPGWLWSVRVRDVDATVLQVLKEGGKILRRPGIDLMGGRMAVVMDPWGAVLGLVEPTGSARASAAGDAVIVPAQVLTVARAAAGAGNGDEMSYAWHDPSFYGAWYEGTALVLPPPPSGSAASGVRAVPASRAAPDVKELVY